MVTDNDIKAGLVKNGAGYALYLIKTALAQQDNQARGEDIPTDPFLTVGTGFPSFGGNNDVTLAHKTYVGV